MKKISITIILFLGLCLSAFTVNADPTIEDITTIPANPEPLSTFTLIATITGEDITSVKVTFSECDDSACFVSQSNIPMSLNEDYKYEAELTLTGTQDSINHIQYIFTINDNGIEYQIEDLKTYLKTDNDNTNNGGNNGTPGFELIIILAAIFISLIILKRKR